MQTGEDFYHGEELNRTSQNLENFANCFQSQFDFILNASTARLFPDISLSFRRPGISEVYAHAVAKTFRGILKTVALNGELTIGECDFVTGEDKQKMVSWKPEPLYGQMNCMHYLVEATARVIPASEAVHSWNGSLSYAQLNNFASIAAQQLVQAGVGHGDYIPFAYEKSLWTVVATLAILKAGAAFVPLDPTHPRARIEEILKSIKANVVVTSHYLAPYFMGLAKRVVVIDAQTVPQRENRDTNYFYSAVVKPSDPIFILFTSGSTGQPKGMIHEHGAICTHAITHGEAMGYHGARMLQFAAHTFDIAIIDIFTTLIFGGCVCVPSEEDRRSDITGAINRMKVDYALLTPSFAGLIEPSDVPGLKTLAIGGEALLQDRVERWADDVSMIQVYGPAEVGICMIMHMRARETLAETVGYPLLNSSCWLVEPENPHRLVPLGAVGELVVAGPSVARGYVNNEAKTRSSFLPNLDWADCLGLQCGRFYKTGDLLRYNTEACDGSFDFVGRRDYQIKLRGQRIELGEVEHHLAAIPGIAISMVSRPEQGCFAGQLVAVVQMHDTKSSRVRDEPVSLAPDQSLSIETVQNHLSKAMPDYMIPTVCLVVASMPFVPSLKINRKEVDAWLMRMDSKPSQAAASTVCLDPGESTANELSLKVAYLVAGDDKHKRERLESHDFSLHSAGINSIQIMALSIFVQKTYKVKLPMEKLLSSNIRIRDIANLIDHPDQSPVGSKKFITIDVHQESRALTKRLFHSIRPQSTDCDLVRDNTIANVFLTGATGYLGSAILKQLMAQPDVHVFALVRCPSESSGLQRVIDAANKTGWWQEYFRYRIHIWKGDLLAPDLGLKKNRLDCLIGDLPKIQDESPLRIHAIIHNGARVHYSSDYETLKPINVNPTMELLKITAQAPALSAFTFVSGGQKPNSSSSMTMNGTTNGHSVPRPLVDNQLANGYTQTKFVSEQIVRNCATDKILSPFQNKSMHIVKPGYIIGSTSSGIANTTDFIWRLVVGCIDIGAYNADEANHWLFVADVDHVASAIVSATFSTPFHLARHHDDSSSETSMVLEGLIFSDMWKLLEEPEFGFGPFEALGQAEWMSKLKKKVLDRGEGHLLFPLLHILETEGGEIGEERKGMVGMNVDEAGRERMKEVIRANVRWLRGQGFLHG